jgi:hypothetical protein
MLSTRTELARIERAIADAERRVTEQRLWIEERHRQSIQPCWRW